MSEQKRRPRQDSEETPDQPEQDQPKPKQTEGASAIDDLIEDIDEAIKLALGFAKDEVVAPEELEQRAQKFAGEFIQKGGQ